MDSIFGLKLFGVDLGKISLRISVEDTESMRFVAVS